MKNLTNMPKAPVTECYLFRERCSVCFYSTLAPGSMYCKQESKRQMNSVYYFLAYIILFSAQSCFFISLSYFLSSKL